MYGRLREADAGWRLEFSRRLAHPPAKVWRALTEPEELGAWFPTTIHGQRKSGAKLQVAFPDGDRPPARYPMNGTMEKRWVAAGDAEAERSFRRVIGCQTTLPVAALRQATGVGPADYHQEAA